MLFDDTYLTIEKASDGVFRDKGSKFLAFAYPITSEGDVKIIVTALKSEHPKANHHCWAMRLSPDRSVFRVNDDGEPSGTAGRPILNTLLSRNLTNVLVVVVRYFGGTLLGVSGLINAYKAATETALDGARVIERTVNDVYIISFDYPQMNEVMKLIKDEQLSILEQAFDNRCQVKLSVRQTQVNRLIGRLQSVLNSNAEYLYTA